MQNKPFSRFLAIASAISAAMGLQTHLQGAALGMIPTYKSRGKGKGWRPAPNFMRNAGRSKYQPDQCSGAGEAARRAKQQARVDAGRQRRLDLWGAESRRDAALASAI